jgi:phosphoglycerate dehydrogenase-like enzyme
MEAGSFRLVQQWGAGLEGVDRTAAHEKGIAVANVPATGGNAESVAEHALLLMLALLRDLPRAQANVRNGILGAPIGKTLAGRTVCLYGLGAIALPLAKRLRNFGVRLIGVTRNPSIDKVEEFGLDECFSVADRDRAFAETDILVLCVRYFEEMRGTIGVHELNSLRRGACLINIARGGLLDKEALYDALVQGHLAGAGLDVFWREPIPMDDAILTLPNVVATPHIAGVTEQSFNDIADAVAANIERLRRGQPLLHQVV